MTGHGPASYPPRMRRSRWPLLLAVILIAAFGALAFAHYAIFGDARTLFYYLLLDVVFVPLQVLFVSLILDRLLSFRKKQETLKKLNMVISAFFSEVGTSLLSVLARFLPNSGERADRLTIRADWSAREFDMAAAALRRVEPKLESGAAELKPLRDFLSRKQDFLLRLLENPSLLEHDSFADLLWAVLHVSEELASRPTLEKLPANDRAHLSGDLTRAYASLLREWVNHLAHLKRDYPYLYSLAVRTNPFDPNASAIIR